MALNRDIRRWLYASAWAGWVLTVVFASGCTNSETRAQTPVRQPVIFFSGGTIDDFVVHMLLLGMEEVDLKGIVLTNADTIDSFGMDAHWKIAHLCNRPDVPIALSHARGWNPFPYVYRQMAIPFNRIPALEDYPSNPGWPPYPSGEILAQSLFQEAINNDAPVTLLVTSPMTALKNVLIQDESLKAAIQKVLFMGGAVHVPGNLEPDTLPKEIANSAAEWNIFWDPEATSWIFENTSFDILLFPLDLTDAARLTDELGRKLRLQAEDHPWSAVASQGYDITWNDPDTFFLWCTAAACYLGRPGLYGNPEALKFSVVTKGFWQGAMEETPSGREVKTVVEFADANGFYDYFLRLLRR